MAFNLEEAARLYTRELLARAWAMLGDWHEAEDAVQDAFAAACEKPPKPGGGVDITARSPRRSL